MSGLTNETRLRIVKTVHTMVWAFMVACIFAIPVLAAAGRFGAAAVCIAIVLFETAVLLANRWRCPLTDVAARYTAEQPVGFDIYLPAWLARYNKLIFGTVFVAALVYTAVRWAESA